jgi:hypothetical protein
MLTVGTIMILTWLMEPSYCNEVQTFGNHKSNYIHEEGTTAQFRIFYIPVSRPET